MDGGYGKTAAYYDKLYAWKDYAAESARLLEILEVKPDGPRRSLLDVACGTGRHIEYLKRHVDAEGLDLSVELLAIARARNPEVTFHVGDMMGFRLGRSFDVVTCLFSSIGYAKTLDQLNAAVQCMADHVKPGGILAIEPWFTPDLWIPNTVHGSFIDEPELKIARVNTSFVDGRVSIFELHHLIGTPRGTEHIVERHEMGLFTVDEMQAAMQGAGWTVEHDPDGLSGRGLYVARRRRL